MDFICEPCLKQSSIKSGDGQHLDNKSIDHFVWRKVLTFLEKALQKVNPKFTVCGPFGFELGWNAYTAPKYIRKFYIYVNNPNSENINVLAGIVQKYAFQCIKKIYPEIYDDFVVVIKNQDIELMRDAGYQCKSTDKLLDIQVRNTNGDILEDYAKYLILVYQSIVNMTGEARNYNHSALCRSRVFQLFIMLKVLYSGLFVGSLADFNKAIFETMHYINNGIQIFFNKNRDEQKEITKEEDEHIVERVLPLCQMIEEKLLASCQDSDIVSLDIETYHILSSKNLSMKMGSGTYDFLLKRVMDTYLNFTDL